MHNTYNALESSPNHPFKAQSLEKLSSIKPISGAKEAGESLLADLLICELHLGEFKLV